MIRLELAIRLGPRTSVSQVREDISAIDRLAYMSNRAMGALQFRPARGPGTQHAFAIHLRELVDTARKAVHGDFDGDDHTQIALRQIIEVGTSAGGARAKAVIAWNRKSEEIRKEEAFRRMVFNVMARNCDDHTKNFAFRLRQGHPWELTPAYDVTFAHSPRSEWTAQHLLSVNGKFKDFTEDDLLVEADRFAIGTAPRVIQQVRRAILAWQTFGARAGLRASEIKRIRLLQLPMLARAAA